MKKQWYKDPKEGEEEETPATETATETATEETQETGGEGGE